MDANESLSQMRSHYLELEREFIEFNNIIPCNHNPSTVYSPRLVTIMQSCGPQIYGMLEFLTNHFSIETKNDKFPSYYKELNEKGMLAFQKVILKYNRRILSPFKFNKDVPSWWTAYNDAKHRLLEGGNFSATLNNVIKILGAIFILHKIAEELMETEQGKKMLILDKRNWRHIKPQKFFRSVSHATLDNTNLSTSIDRRLFSAVFDDLQYFTKRTFLTN